MKSLGIGMVVMGLLLSATGCSTASNDSSGRTADAAADAKAAESLQEAADPRAMFGTQAWKLLDIPGYAGPIPTETRAPLTIELVTTEAGLRLQGNGGCNGFAMAFAMNGLVLKPGPISASKMACEHSGFEAAYFGVLAKIDGVRRQGAELQLLVGGDAVLRYVVAG